MRGVRFPDLMSLASFRQMNIEAVRSVKELCRDQIPVSSLLDLGQQPHLQADGVVPQSSAHPEHPVLGRQSFDGGSAQLLHVHLPQTIVAQPGF